MSYQSDLAAAIEQAILDGVDVLCYSAGGGQDPYGEVPSLALLAAYERGVFVAAPAGNGGPGAGTVVHREPWVMSVAASSQARTLDTKPYLELGGSVQRLVASTTRAGTAPKQGDVVASFSARGGPGRPIAHQPGRGFGVIGGIGGIGKLGMSQTGRGANVGGPEWNAVFRPFGPPRRCGAAVSGVPPACRAGTRWPGRSSPCRGCRGLP